MNDFEKACAVIAKKKYSFEAMSQASGASIPTLKAYRANPDKLKSAKWEVVHKLADMYGKKLYKSITDETVVDLVQQYFSVIGGGDEKNTVNKWKMFFQFDRIIIKYRGEVVAIVNQKGQLIGKLAYATEVSSIVGEYNPKASYANFDAERVESMIFDDLAFVKELETYQKIVSQHKEEGSKMNGLFKVDDAKHLERGWAKVVDGKVISDSNFDYYKAGQQLILKEDQFTIDNEATDALAKEQTQRKAEIAKKNQTQKDELGAKMIGKVITTKHGQGEVIAYDGARLIVDYGDQTRAMPINSFKEVDHDED